MACCCKKYLKDIIAALEAQGDPPDCNYTVQQWKVKKYYAGLENTKTWFNRSYIIRLTNGDGTIKTVSMDATTGWLAQMTEWEAKLAAAYPELCEVKNHWWESRSAFLPNTGNGAIPPADFDFPAARGQYIQFEACPENASKLPVSAEIINVNGNDLTNPVPLIFATGEGKTEYVNVCATCGECENGEIPKCAIPVGEDYPELPTPACQFTTINGCDLVDDDPSNDVSIVAVYALCDGDTAPSVEYFEDDGNGNLTEYNNGNGVIGVFGDCNSRDEFEPPAPETTHDDVVAALDDVVSAINARRVVSVNRCCEYDGVAGKLLDYSDGFTQFIANDGMATDTPDENLIVCDCGGGESCQCPELSKVIANFIGE